MVGGALHDLTLVDFSDDDAPFGKSRSTAAQREPSRRLVLVPGSVGATPQPIQDRAWDKRCGDRDTLFWVHSNLHKRPKCFWTPESSPHSRTGRNRCWTPKRTQMCSVVMPEGPPIAPHFAHLKIPLTKEPNSN